MPAPIDAWDDFDRLFAWDRRPIDTGGAQVATTYVGAAVRSFFAQGGRKCYVVRVGDPWPLSERPDDAAVRAADLIPGFPQNLAAFPADRTTWRGLGVLLGLPEVAFALAPDLPDIFGSEPLEIQGDPPDLEGEIEEQFVECSAPAPPPEPDSEARFYAAPRCTADGYREWARAVWRIAQFLRLRRREMQFIGALPLPALGSEAAVNPVDFLERTGPLADPLDDAQAIRISSAFVQLAYPWVRTPASRNLPRELESPDGVLAGVLARNALARGGFRSAASLELGDVYAVDPVMDRPPVERVSVLGPTPSGLRLLSDVTTSRDENYRPASVSRLTASVMRAARRLGEESAFDPNGENLWARLRARLNSLLAGLHAQGALRGDAKEAFAVICDRTTMTQQDIDSGRVVAIVEFQAAVPIERIHIRLALDEGGRISLLSNSVEEAA